jgi:hypothetical protein
LAVVDDGVRLETATENSHSVATVTAIAGVDVEVW